ncbi:MAG: hypothetical protein DDT22_00946 [candidate division WS2 bacterium]|nr:hypothetical protein [Bacillota bacterium]MBT9175272.1 hypothetical protein [Candidatus Lithacetigena glycinireducens]
MKMEKQIFEDTSIVAFLSLKGFKITPQKLDNGRIIFSVEGENITQALQDLYNNEKVGVLDFIKSIKGVRSFIFAFKGR